jgi:hypothetical protein
MKLSLHFNDLEDGSRGRTRNAHPLFARTYTNGFFADQDYPSVTLNYPALSFHPPTAQLTAHLTTFILRVDGASKTSFQMKL